MNSRNRQQLIGAVAVGVALILLAFLIPRACGQEWTAVPPIRQSGLPGLLGELEDRMPAQHIYRDDDKITWAHETTHGLNSQIRNSAGPGMNAVYLYGCGAVVLKEPPVTIAQVAATVKQRGRLFDLYLVKQQRDWNNQPLYLVDELVAYVNGTIVGYEWGSCDVQGEHENAAEMHRYCCTMYRVVKATHPEYDAEKLRDLLNSIRSYLITIGPDYSNASQDVACVAGRRSGGLFDRLRFRRRMPAFPCQPNVLPTPPEPTPDWIGHGHKAEFDALRAELAKLAAMIEAIPAGEKGDPGEQGKPGEDGQDAVIDLDDLVDKVIAQIPDSSDTDLAVLQAKRDAEIAIKRADEAKSVADENSIKLGDLTVRLQRVENLDIEAMVKSGKLRFRLYFDKHGNVVRAETLSMGVK